MAPMRGPKLHILLCAPRGFCAGVERAIQVVEEALERFGAPAYVGDERVPNREVAAGRGGRGERAIQVGEEALERFGAPVYVRHEIVHNRYVVEELKRKGAIFVEELDEIPVTNRPVVFSAHGVPKSIPAAASARNLFFLDATCPLVSKV